MAQHRYRIGDRILFGAAYYPEYQPVERLDTDFGLMRDAGFSLIRVGESVWSTWEPRDGEFELEWLDRVLDAAHDHDVAVVLGTPTYAVPPWLMRKHPEIAAEERTGVPVPWGARQETDTSHPVFRRYAERVIRAVVDRYAGHPAVVGFQVDNEPGNVLAHNEHVFAGFKAWLLERYGDVSAVNDAWNLTHWAHRMSDLAELWRPDGNHVPQYDLAWRRYQAELTTEYIAWQTALVKEYASPDQAVFTCIDIARPAVDDHALGRVVDVVAANQYHATQDELGPDAEGGHEFPPSGSWAPFFVADRTAAASGGERFMVTETNATSVGFPWFNHPAYDGQWRQVAWAMIARGARAVEYWHWHTMHGSWETFWGGILPHSFRPGRVYEQVAQLGREIRTAGATVEGLTPDAGVALVYSMPTRWAFEFHPPLQDPSADPRKQGGPDRAAYERMVYRWYGGLSRAGHQVRVVHADDLTPDGAELPPVVVAPALYLATDAQLAALRAYAAAGGHLVLGARSLYADEVGRPRLDRQPAGLADAAGAWYDEFSNLLVPVPVTGGLTGHATGLIEGLTADGADVVAGYDHPHFGRWAAVTTREYGAGRVTYAGMVPDLELATALGTWLGPVNPWLTQLVPGAVTAHGATNAAGQRLWFVHNFGFEPHTVTPPVPVADVLTGASAERLELGPWDVRILRETTP
ncbi:beta-galactosidase [Jiangella alkaliphila]|uniref:beta-galactosidase n=1 Tax=Jiangella alkaliphila TaxID=419479 RepID=A0A1H2GW31_9ACTN|nr:beta-galactosidase [Jiangella alkaliphila]SDU23793.1 beta-galactosidase [Jiangella alkaliphila]